MEAFGAAVGAEIVGAVAGSVVTVALSSGTPLLLKGSPSARANNAEQHLKAAIETLKPEIKRMDEKALSIAAYQIRKTMDARLDYQDSTAFFERLSYSINFERLSMKAHKTAEKESISTRQEYLSIEIHARIGSYDQESENSSSDLKGPGKDNDKFRPTLIKKFLARTTRKPVKTTNIPLHPIRELSEPSPEGELCSHDQEETLHEFSIQIDEEPFDDDVPCAASSAKQVIEAEAPLATNDVNAADVAAQVAGGAAVSSA